MLRWLFGLALVLCATPAWASGSSAARECRELAPVPWLDLSPAPSAAAEVVEPTTPADEEPTAAALDDEPVEVAEASSELELMLLLTRLPSGPRCGDLGSACYPDERPLLPDVSPPGPVAGGPSVTLIPPDGRLLRPAAAACQALPRGDQPGVFRPPRLA